MIKIVLDIYAKALNEIGAQSELYNVPDIGVQRKLCEFLYYSYDLLKRGRASAVLTL